MSHILNIFSFILIVSSAIGFHPLKGQISIDEIIAEYQEFQDELGKNKSISWSDNSPEVIDKKTAFYKKTLNALESLEIKQLSETDLINQEMLHFIIDDKLYHLNYGTYLMPLNSEGGFITSMIYFANDKVLKSPKKQEDYLAKINDTPRYISQQIDFLKKGVTDNKIRPKLVVENCITVLKDVLSKKDDAFFLFNPLKGKEIEKEIKREEIIAAFEKLLQYLENDYLINAPEKIGIIENQHGDEFYEQRVRYYTTLDMSPKDVFEKGLSEVKRIREEMQEVIAELKYDGTFDEFVNYLRTDKRFYAQTENELLYYAAWLSKKAEEVLPRYFGKLPRLPFTVNPVPAAFAPNYTTGRYSRGSMDDYKAGEYWVNTYNLPSRPLYVLPALTLHEAVPGHHLQLSLANEMSDLPKFRSHYLSAYGEGWGLYAEYLGKEAGLYETLYEEFGRMTYEMWRACRLVVDPGMHYFGWTREEAVKYMKDNTSLSLHEINTEINRYIGWPGQAVSYKIGELKIRELRALAEQKLVDKFDIRKFHDIILANGSIPLMTLVRIVEKFIDDALAGAE